MADRSQGPKGRDGVLSSLNMAIGALNRAKEAKSATPAKATFTSAGILLTMIRDSMVNKVEYVELGLACADVCETLNRGMDRRQADELSQSILGAIEKFTTTMDEIQKHIIKWGKRNVISRGYHAKDDKKAITAWKLNLDGVLHIFNTELWMNPRAAISDTHQDAANKHTIVSNFHRDTSDIEVIVPDVRRDASDTNPTVSGVRSDAANTHTVASDIHSNKLKGREGVDGRNQATHASAPGESPPPVQRDAGTTSRRMSEAIPYEIQTMVSDIRQVLKSQAGANGQHLSTQKSVPGELPPPPPRVFFGRDELIEKIVGFAQRLTPIALIGAGGIGKTSTILTVLHDDRIKQRFGDTRRFIRCDEFPASRAHFLRRLSKVIGADIENPEDLTPLRRHLSSKEMVIVLDNAESILDPQGTSAKEIYAAVDELTRFSNVCLCITSRISTVPPHCEAIHIPTLSMVAAHDTFYRIYKHGEPSDPINDILEQLDFHPLSITLLATVAQHNTWDTDRLTREWERQRTGVLHAQHFGSLIAMIELSLASPLFRGLGPDARELLGVIAFFPKGVNEKNIDWLLPTISDGPDMFDKFCTLSLTYRSNGFITMLAPLRDCLLTKDPTSSLLLSTTMESYFSQLSAYTRPDEPGFEESRWITSEDVNVEYLLDVFMSIDASPKNVWDACADFMDHLDWHKPRPIMLGPKIEALPDDHPSKARCLHSLSRLFGAIGNQVEYKRILTRTLNLWREQGDNFEVARILCDLSAANRGMGLYKEGIEQAKESSEIFKQLGHTANRACSLISLAYVLCEDKQLDAAEEAASLAIDLLLEKDEQLPICEGHRVLGEIYRSKGDTEKAVHHFEAAIETASSLNLENQVFWAHYALARLFSGEGRFDDAHAYIERAKSHAIDDAYNQGRAMGLQASSWYDQRMFEKARSEASHAADIFEKLGAAHDLEECRKLFQRIDEQMNNPVV